MPVRGYANEGYHALLLAHCRTDVHRQIVQCADILSNLEVTCELGVFTCSTRNVIFAHM